VTLTQQATAVNGEQIWALWGRVKDEARAAALEAQQECLQALVEAWVSAWVGRAKGEPMGAAEQGQATCLRCGEAGHIRYAGHYRRRLLLCEGVIELTLPRLRCRCGAWLGYTIPWLGRRRRLGADVAARALELAGMRVSLRDAAASIGRAADTSLSPQTVLRVLERLPADRPEVPMPREIGFDGVYVRCRGRSRVILMAQDEGRGIVIDWEDARGESARAYRRLVRRLWRRGAQVDNGLRRVLGDGAGGLWQVVDEHWLGVAKTECWWHQLVADRQAGRPATPRPAGEGRMSTARLERSNREFRRRYRQMEAFRGKGSVGPTMRLFVERTLARRTGSDWLAALMRSWLRPDRRAMPSFAPCS